MFLKRFLISFFVIIIFINAQAQDTQNIELAAEYYEMGENEKAQGLYEKLIRDSKNIPLVHTNYFELLLVTANYTEALRYIDRRIKESPDNVYYPVDKGIIYKRSGQQKEETEYFKKIIGDVSNDEYKTRLVSQYLIKNQMLDYAVDLYLLARNKGGNPELYTLELANIYRVLNKRELMIEEYLNYAGQGANNINYVKSVLQAYLEESSALEYLEGELILLLQKQPESRTYSDLLIWTNIQLKNFYGAFIQARAYDRKFDRDGNKILEVGFIALENKSYNNAIQIFDYLSANFRDNYVYPIARRYRIKSREELVKNTFPVEVIEIRKLATEYDNLVREFGVGVSVAEAMLSKAQLHAFYLDEIDSAITILNAIVNIPRINPDLVARCKLELGDIYILAGEPWESMLLYGQVEKSRKETPIGYEAKLKSAKLSYYKGDFILAQEHLDVLKLATSREISNDALFLGQLIKNNTIMDTSDFLLRKYASIELLLFQNKKSIALDSLNRMVVKYKGSPLTDEIYFLVSRIQVEMGMYEQAIASLEQILNEYPEDILADDALFRIGEIYEYHLRNNEKAKEIFNQLLIRYPGSIYTSEARKHYRYLRGDLIN